MMCYWSKHIWFSSLLDMVFNLHNIIYVSFQERGWKKNVLKYDLLEIKNALKALMLI